MERKWLTAKDIAAAAGVSRKTVHQWTNDGRLTPAFVGSGIRGERFYDPADVDEFLAHRQETASE